MKNDRTSQIVLVLEILLIVLLHMSKGTGTKAPELVKSNHSAPTQTVITTVQPIGMTQ